MYTGRQVKYWSSIPIYSWDFLLIASVSSFYERAISSSFQHGQSERLTGVPGATELSLD